VQRASSFCFGVHVQVRTVRVRQVKLINCADQWTVVCGFCERWMEDMVF
jgi:hypothetical protein